MRNLADIGRASYAQAQTCTQLRKLCKGAPSLPGKEENFKAVECHEERAALMECDSLPQRYPAKKRWERQAQN
jgi:hypothetical protein